LGLLGVVLLVLLLHPDPAQRIKMEGMLRHPWFLTGKQILI
jgi:hypothetical protein